MLIHLTTAAADLSTDTNVILLNVSLVATLANVTVPFKSLQSQKNVVDSIQIRNWTSEYEEKSSIPIPL